MGEQDSGVCLFVCFASTSPVQKLKHTEPRPKLFWPTDVWSCHASILQNQHIWTVMRAGWLRLVHWRYLKRKEIWARSASAQDLKKKCRRVGSNSVIFLRWQYKSFHRNDWSVFQRKFLLKIWAKCLRLFVSTAYGILILFHQLSILLESDAEKSHFRGISQLFKDKQMIFLT